MSTLNKIKSVALALALAVALAPAAAQASTSTTNFSSIGVGSVPSSTYLYLTGVAEVWKEIPLTSILTGTNGTTALADTAITTGLYVTQVTGLTNTPAVAFPTQTNGGVASFSVTVPHNYRSGARLVAAWHAGGAFTQGQLSFTADAYVQSAYWSTTSVAKTAGTAVQINPAAEYQNVTQAATITLSVSPFQRVQFKLSKAGTAAIPQLTGLWFVYRPSGVLEGR
jgi:hypothetical protein